MISINFRLNENELVNCQAHYRLQQDDPTTPFSLQATWELMLDGKNIAIGVSRDVSIIDFAIELRYALGRIDVGQVMIMVYSDNSGSLVLIRDEPNIITLVDYGWSTVPVNCKLVELKSASDDFGARLYHVISDRLPELLDIEGNRIREGLLSNGC